MTTEKRSRRAGVLVAAAVFGATLPWALLGLLRDGHALSAAALIVGVVFALALLLGSSRRNG